MINISTIKLSDAGILLGCVLGVLWMAWAAYSLDEGVGTLLVLLGAAFGVGIGSVIESARKEK